MAELQTKLTKASVTKFLAGIKDERRREDSLAMLAIMKKITKEPPRMWGPSIVGFGEYRYKYASGREAVFCSLAFSPRKESLTVYLISGFAPFPDLMKRLGKYKTGKGCLYIKSLDDIHLPTLRKLIAGALALNKKRAASL